MAAAICLVFASGSAMPLAGGASVPAAQVELVEAPVHLLSHNRLSEAVAVMTRRIAHLGVRDSVVRAQGDDVLVKVPKSEAGRVVAVLGQRGELLFRPVDCVILPYSPHTRAERSPTFVPPASAPPRRSPLAVPAVCRMSSTRQSAYRPRHADRHGDTREAYDTKDASVVLSFRAGYRYGRYILGPAEMTGAIIKSAAAVFDRTAEQWEVYLTFTPAGSALFNHYAARHYACYVRQSRGPRYCAQQATDLDATLESVATVESSSFSGAATISGRPAGRFTRQQAAALAVLASFGPLPAAFTVVNVSTVTPQQGRAVRVQRRMQTAVRCRLANE